MIFLWISSRGIQYLFISDVGISNEAVWRLARVKEQKVGLGRDNRLEDAGLYLSTILTERQDS